MANVKVAVRVRPLDKREKDLQSPCIVEMSGAKTILTDPKVHNSRKEFSYDHSYWSADPSSPHFCSQEKVFSDLGTDVLQCAQDGYNSCVFAYGQTGSGKTFTMMGTQENRGLIPRICQGLFDYMDENAGLVSFKVDVSYMEIYNEKVRDLLRPSAPSSSTSPDLTHNLRVREHPRDGPYVENLTKHLVSDFSAIQDLMTVGNSHRVTASTLMNDVSSRSHAIFTIMFTQAKFELDMPSETISRLNLVDLAGSERASATGATGDRLKEGGSINKSLVTLGNVISALADISIKSKPQAFVPYRDSVLTWLLKDSLGGNAKTIMVATVSPAAANFGESLSTLRYANRAKNIMNKPTVNEDSNVKLIRELKAEIERLKFVIAGDKTLSDRLTGLTSENIHKREEQIAELTKTWAGKWKDMQRIIEEKELALHSDGVKMMVASELPHFIGVDDDLLGTGVVLYHLQSGVTKIGSEADTTTRQCIVLEASDIKSTHCRVESTDRVVTLFPEEGKCFVNGEHIEQERVLAQGSLVQFGSAVFLRFNHPQEALKLKEQRRKSSASTEKSAVSRNTSLLSAAYSPFKDAELKEEREKMERERQEFEKQKEGLEKEFAHKVALIRQEVEEEKERLREETEKEVEQLKEQQLLGKDSGFPMNSHASSTPVDCEDTDYPISPGLAGVHPESSKDEVKDWSTSHSDFEKTSADQLECVSNLPGQDVSRVSMEGVKPNHYHRKLVGKEAEESQLPSRILETQEKSLSSEKSQIRKSLFQSPRQDDNSEDDNPLTKSQFTRVLTKKEIQLQQQMDTITRQQEDKAQLEKKLKDLAGQVNTSTASTDSPVSKPLRPSVNVSVSDYGTRRTGMSEYFIFEISVITGKEKWKVFRRFSQFKTMHSELKEKYPQLSSLLLPPGRVMGTRTTEQISGRRYQLDEFVRSVIAICSNIPGCPIYTYRRDKTSLKTMRDFNAFFAPNVVEAPVNLSRTQSPYENRWSDGTLEDFEEDRT